MNILLICESANDKTSGGKVVRYISKILKEQGHDVKLLVLEKKNKEFYSDQLCSSYQIEFMLFNKQERFFSLFYNTLNINKYIRILENFKPDVVHFASFLNSKPAKLISEAKKSGAKVILQPWTMHFYCEQGFGFRKMKQCTNCIEKGYLEAYKSKCTNAVGLINQFERYILNKVALEADIVLSSNQDLDEILKKYGVSEKKIMRFPVPFDYDLIKKNSLKEEDYYIYYGQMNDHKGGKIILQIFKKSEELKLKIYPMN
jgi:glycosyltransferase involved in cell wall biosynthesis